jgi:hypothetical protein
VVFSAGAVPGRPCRSLVDLNGQGNA